MLTLGIMDDKKNVFCCGNAAYDLVITKRKPNGGYVMEACPGGSVFNTSVILARMGLNVSLIARVGTDLLSDNLLEIMRREKISTRHIERNARLKAPLAIARVDKTGDSSYTFYRDTGPEIAPHPRKDIFSGLAEKNVFHAASAFSYSDHSFKPVLTLMEQASASGIFSTYDPNWRSSRIFDKRTAVSRIRKLFALASLIKLSDSDALGINGSKTLMSALKKMPKKTILTLGNKGSLFWNGKIALRCPAVKVKTVDTIGAGDAFMAGIIFRYCRTGSGMFWEEMPENLSFASRVAARVCSSRGAVSGIKPSSSPSARTRDKRHI